MRVQVLALLSLPAFALAACDDTLTEAETGEVASTAVPENVCVNELSNQTGDEAYVIDSLYSEAGTQVTLAVPSAESTYTCFASNDGTIESLSYDGEG